MPEHRAFDVSDSRSDVILMLAALAVAVLACFYPLLGTFFSQDDFYLMYRASHEAGEMLSSDFGPHPHHFRPLTKVLYFAAAYRVFGLHPMPWHLVSLAVHALNALMVFLLLRKLRVSAAAAAAATGFFALNVAFLEVVGWITCMQQLVAALFMLLSIYFGIDAEFEIPGRRRAMLISLACYILALSSLEQTFLTPVLIMIIAVTGISGRARAPWSAVKALWPQLMAMLAYTAVRLLWKGLPTSGISVFVFGRNIAFNLTAYLSAMYNFWPDVSALIPYRPGSFAPSHFVLLVLVIYNVARQRLREVIFALIFIVFALLPALPLVGHYFLYHTYVAAFGAVYLIALTVDDAFATLGQLRLSGGHGRTVAALIVILVVASLSFWKVRENVDRVADPKTRAEGSFVLRRGMIARNAFKSLEDKKLDMTGVKRVEVVYGWPGREKFGGVTNDIHWALSKGYAVRMALHEYKLDAVELPTTWSLDTYEASPDKRVLFCDPTGYLYTYDEVMSVRR